MRNSSLIQKDNDVMIFFLQRQETHKVSDTKLLQLQSRKNNG